MKKKRYRITRRGYVVFGSLGLCLIIFIAMVFKPHLTEPSAKEVAQKTAQVQKDSAKQPSQTNPASNEANTSKQEAATTPKESASMTSKEINEILKQVTITVYFMPDEYALDDSYYSSLSQIVDMSVRFKNAHITIYGHYNDKPSGVRTPFREQLAQNRAEVVEAYLTSQGIAQERIKVINKGASEPVNQDDTWDEIQKNRRVVVSFEPMQ